MADTFAIISVLVLVLVSSFLFVLCCFLELFFDDELPRNDLDVCVSTDVSPVSIIGNSYTLITNLRKKGAGLGLVQTQTDRKGR